MSIPGAGVQPAGHELPIGRLTDAPRMRWSEENRPAHDGQGQSPAHWVTTGMAD